MRAKGEAGPRQPSTVLPRPSMVQTIADRLQEEIASGVFPVGTRLPALRLLAERFGVNQATAREAIRVLRSHGMVRVRHGSGVYVEASTEHQVSRSLLLLLQLNRASSLQVLDVRSTLETRCTELAAAQASEEDVARLRRALTDYERATDVDALLDALDRFHSGIGDAAGNPFLASITRFFLDLVLDAQRATFADKDFTFWQDWSSRYQADRYRILEAIATHDVAAALDAARVYHRHLASEWQKAFIQFGEPFTDCTDHHADRHG